MSLFDELKRRNVIRVAIGYVGVSWLLIQVIETLFSIFDINESIAQTIVIILAIGFIPVLVIAWKFELTPDGLKRDAEADHSAPGMREMGARFDRIVTVVLVVAVGYFAVDKFVLDPDRDKQEIAAAVEQAIGQVRIDELVASFGDRSIAVLPFVNMSDDKEQEYFADGITEELLNLLAQIGDLRVISRSSAFQYKGKDIHVPTVAAELRVAHILEGSVRRDGDAIRVTAQLIDASDSHLWSDTYDREFEEVFKIQDEIAAKVVDSLKIHLAGDVLATRKREPEVYALFLKANHLLNLNHEDATEEARALLQRALEIDAQDVDVLSALSRVVYRSVAPDGPELARRRVMPLIEAIRRIDPDHRVPLAWDIFFALNHDQDFERGARGIEELLRIASTDPLILRSTLSSIPVLGAVEEAIAISEYVVAMDPLCGQCQYQLQRAYRLNGQFDEAEGAARAAMILLPERSGMPLERDLARTLFFKGEFEAALEVAVEAKALQVQAAALYKLGRNAEYAGVLQQAKEADGASHPAYVAWTYAAIGEYDLALEWLEKPTEHDPAAKARELEYWVFRPLRDNPRFVALQEEIGVSPAQLEAINFRPSLPPGVTIN
jgi:TolB-like protein